MPFKWHPNERPPQIEEHSKAKLTVLRSYLRAYFDRLGSSFVREDFKLDLIDGFAGGGLFLDDDVVVPGSPLIMLEESGEAKTRLSEKRRKPLNFDFRHYFVDVEEDHVKHLQRALDERGYSLSEDKIVIHQGRFGQILDDIIAEILRRQPKAGRSIFLLDQCGYSQVELALVGHIFRNLPAAEVILTFAADALINYLANTPTIVRAVSPLDLTDSKVSDLIQLKGGDGGKALVQRTLRAHIRSVTGANYDTPFFIRPRQSRRALWFLHLSRHPTARDVMVQCHWNASNTFEHYGPGGFEMLGWDALRSETIPLFGFGEHDGQKMRSQLLEAMPRELTSLTSEGAITVDAMHHTLANKTAARFEDYDDVVINLFRGKEIEILSPDGKVRSRSLSQLRPTDRIAFPSQLTLSLIRRRR